MLNTKLPRYIEPYKLADHKGRISGALPEHWFERAKKDLLHSIQSVHADLIFDRDEEGRRVVIGQIVLQAEQLCQRCLQPMQIELELSLNYGLVFHEQMGEQLPAHLDAWQVVPDEKVDVLPIIEDEIILSVSEFAMHDPGQCNIKKQFLGGSTDDKNSKAVEKENPFSILGQIKKDQLKSGDS